MILTIQRVILRFLQHQLGSVNVQKPLKQTTKLVRIQALRRMEPIIKSVNQKLKGKKKLLRLSMTLLNLTLITKTSPLMCIVLARRQKGTERKENVGKTRTKTVQQTATQQPIPPIESLIT